MAIHARGRFWGSMLVSVGLLAGMSGAARAADLPVSITLDEATCVSSTVCSLRARVAQANATPELDVITLPPNTYPLSLGELVVTQPLKIVGDATNPAVIDGTLTSRIFHVRGDKVSLELNGVTLKNGNANKQLSDDCLQRGGAVCAESGTLVSLSGVRVEGSRGHHGGGLFANMVSVTNTVSVKNSTFTGNIATDAATDTTTVDGAGGGMFVQGGSLSIAGSTINGNSAALGGGIAVADATSVSITNSTVDGNLATTTGLGGGIDIEGTTTGVTLQDVTISDNTPAGLYLADTVSATLTNCLFAQSKSGIALCAGKGTITATSVLEQIAKKDATVTCSGAHGILTPKLGALGLNDSTTGTATRALTTGSEAIDAGGGCEAQDQRGVARDQSKCDAGAYEVGDVVKPKPDMDHDGVPDESDNCPTVFNPPQGDPPVQADRDCDGIGDACDTSEIQVGPGLCLQTAPKCLVRDQCPCDHTPEGAKWHGRKDWKKCVRTSLPACTPQAEMKDVLRVGKQKACGVGDRDGDTVPNTQDNCSAVKNPQQKNCDAAAERAKGQPLRGDACDDDWDGDGVPNDEDNCPYQRNSNQIDADQDGVGNECDCCPFTNPLGAGKVTGPNGCTDNQDPKPSEIYALFPDGACDINDKDHAPKNNCYLKRATGWPEAGAETIGGHGGKKGTGTGSTDGSTAEQ